MGPFKASFIGDIDIGIGKDVDIDMEIDPWGPCIRLQETPKHKDLDMR